MRAVVQRVKQASVSVHGRVVGRIEHGLCAFVGVHRDDSERDVQVMVTKLCRLRVFTDAEDKMNLGVLDVAGSLLAISQFTLFGDVRRGYRPSFSEAMEPVRANELFEQLCAGARAQGLLVEQGRFGAHMQVSLLNDGPVTILIDSRKEF